MDLTIKVFKIHNIEKIEEELKIVNEVNYLRVITKLKVDYEQIVNLFKLMKDQGLIKSIFIPKNKRIQKEINNLIIIKKDIKKSINKINSLFR